ncbi:hypothetical protein DRN52_04965 [Thermococci archaeon]|nr:MAG: hypothetical protein DRN52_04965 [Thermococci archaeon]
MTSEISTLEILKKFGNIVDLLRYHVACGRFSFVDRINAAMDPRIVEETLREAIRAIIGIEPSSRSVYRIKFEREEEASKVTFEKQPIELVYCESKELKERDVLAGKIPSRIWLHGTVVKTRDGKYLACFTPPRIPSESEISEFMDIISTGDLSVARKIAHLALFRPTRRGR